MSNKNWYKSVILIMTGFLTRVIMPINNDELINLIDKKNEYEAIIKIVRGLFIEEETKFDMEWRDRFITTMFC